MAFSAERIVYDCRCVCVYDICSLYSRVLYSQQLGTVCWTENETLRSLVLMMRMRGECVIEFPVYNRKLNFTENPTNSPTTYYYCYYCCCAKFTLFRWFCRVFLCEHSRHAHTVDVEKKSRKEAVDCRRFGTDSPAIYVEPEIWVHIHTSVSSTERLNFCQTMFYESLQARLCFGVYVCVWFFLEILTWIATNKRRRNFCGGCNTVANIGYAFVFIHNLLQRLHDDHKLLSHNKLLPVALASIYFVYKWTLPKAVRKR